MGSLRRSTRRIELLRAPSPLGMTYTMDPYETERHQQAMANLDANRRFLESSLGAECSFRRAEHDMLYRILFHYDDYGMDRELDAALAFVLEKYALGVLDSETDDEHPHGLMYPPLALHTKHGGEASPDCELSVDSWGWPPSRGHGLPPAVRNVVEQHVFGDGRDRWFVRNTFQRVRELPPGSTLYKRFLLVVLIAMEPELRECAMAHCPEAMVVGHVSDRGGYSLPRTLEELTKELVAQFNQYTAVAVIKGYMTRVACTYDMGGVIR